MSPARPRVGTRLLRAAAWFLALSSAYWTWNSWMHVRNLGQAPREAFLPRDAEELSMRIETLVAIAVGVAWVHAVSSRRRRAEEELRRSEAGYRLLVESVGEGVVRVDPGERVLYANARAEAIFGMPEGGLVGRSLREFTDEDQYGLILGETARRRAGERSTYHMAVTRPDGARRDLLVTAEPHFGEDGSFAGTIGVLRDDTDRQRAFGELRMRDAILEAAALAEQILLREGWDSGVREAFRILGTALGVSRVYLFENHWGEGGELLASQRQEWTAAGVSPQIQNPDLQGLDLVAAGFARWVESMGRGDGIVGSVGGFPQSERDILRAQDILSLAAFPVSVGGAWWGFVGFDDCTSERAWSHAEVSALRLVADLLGAALQRRGAEAERVRLVTAIEQADETVVITDLEGNITYANPAFERITGYTREEALGLNPRILSSGRHDRAFFEDLWTALGAGRTWRGRFINRKKDGSRYTEDASISPIRGEGGAIEGYVAVKKDVTLQEEMRIRLERTREIESLGRFFAGVANEVRNPLQAIEGASEALRSKELSEGDRAELVDLLHAQTRRLAALMGDLVTLAHPEGGEPPAEVSAGDLLRAAAKRAQEAVPGHAPRVRVEGSGLGEVLSVRRGRVERLLAELVENALQHAPEGSPVDLSAEGEGAQVVFRVRDRGPGIPEEFRERVFLPFFTLRRGGTGLGLNYARIVALQHGGSVDLVPNAPPPGCTAEVRLPARVPN